MTISRNSLDTNVARATVVARDGASALCEDLGVTMGRGPAKTLSHPVTGFQVASVHSIAL